MYAREEALADLRLGLAVAIVMLYLAVVVVLGVNMGAVTLEMRRVEDAGGEPITILTEDVLAQMPRKAVKALETAARDGSAMVDLTSRQEAVWVGALSRVGSPSRHFHADFRGTLIAIDGVSY